MRISRGEKFRILRCSEMVAKKWLTSAIYRRAPPARFTDLHENRYTYRSHPDAKKSLLRPEATPNRKAATLNGAAILGVSHMSYFFELLLEDSSDRLQNRCVATRQVCDQKLLKDYDDLKGCGRGHSANFDDSP